MPARASHSKRQHLVLIATGILDDWVSNRSLHVFLPDLVRKKKQTNQIKRKKKNVLTAAV